MEESIARRWIVRGRVQGVYFRAFVQRKASALGLGGYARNLPDGSVEVLAVGAPKQVSTLVKHLSIGPSRARVDSVQEQPLPEERFHLRPERFEIR